MQFKIVHFTDLHLCPLNHIPLSRTDSYHKDIADELLLLKNQIAAENADAVVFSGDLFHLKNQAAYSPKDLNYYYEILKDFPKFYCIPGNHDLPKSSLANLKDSPYSNLLLSLPNMQDVSFPNTISIPISEGKTFHTFKVIGIPYIPINVFKDTLTNLFDKFDFREPGVMYGFLVHVDALPEPLLVNLWASFVYQELTEIFPNNSVLMLGHIHQSFPPFHNPQKNVFISKPWSMGRVVKDYFNQTDVLQHQHLPGYSVISFVEAEQGFQVGIEYKPLQGFKPSSDIFVLESLKTQLEKSKEIQNFIQGIKQGMGESTNPFFVADPMLYLQGLNIQKEVFEVIQEYLNK